LGVSGVRLIIYVRRPSASAVGCFAPLRSGRGQALGFAQNDGEGFGVPVEMWLEGAFYFSGSQDKGRRKKWITSER